jgi:NADH-quinone oxidoreductase subunit L
MRTAMVILGIGALFGGIVQIPGVTDVLTKFFEGTFESSTIESSVDVSVKDSYIGLVIGGLISFTGIAIAFYLYIVAPGSTLRLRDRMRGVHDFLFHKWYFDEVIDALIYRPAIAIGRFANDRFERVVVDGIVRGVSGGVSGLGGAVRTAQSGFVRFYALLVVAGLVGLGLYFLVVSG